jgi:hypothetical protein
MKKKDRISEREYQGRLESLLKASENLHTNGHSRNGVALLTPQNPSEFP